MRIVLDTNILARANPRLKSVARVFFGSRSLIHGVGEAADDEEDDPVLETATHRRMHVLCTLNGHFHHRAILPQVTISQYRGESRSSVQAECAICGCGRTGGRA